MEQAEVALFQPPNWCQVQVETEVVPFVLEMESIVIRPLLLALPTGPAPLQKYP